MINSGAQQGDVQGGLEASASIAEQARHTTNLIHVLHSQGKAPTPTGTRLMMCYVRQASAERKRAKQQWDDLTPRANRHLLMTQNASDPLREVAPDGGLVYILIMYDGTFITDPALVTAVLGTYDQSCTRPDAEGTSNATNTVAMLYASDDQLNNAGGFWTHSGAELTSTHPCS